MTNFKSNLHKMSVDTVTEFWNDSCGIADIEYAIDHGATGATTNPVIVGQVLKGDMEKYRPVIQSFVKKYPSASEDEIAWMLNEDMAAKGAALFKPLYDETQGKRGYISIQTNTKYFNNAEKIIAQAIHFGTIAENIMVKMPATSQGILAIEECTYQGIPVNATVSFSVSQAICTAEAIERGLKRRQEEGKSNDKLYPVCTIMVGRVDDYLKSVAEKENIIADPLALEMAGVAVFKNAYKIYKEKNYRTRLLAAAYRSHHHWSEFIGGDVSMTIPPKWIRRFNGSSVPVENRMDREVDENIIRQLKDNFADFYKVYEPDGMKAEEFDSFGATKATLMQFLNGYDDMVKIVRDFIVNK